MSTTYLPTGRLTIEEVRKVPGLVITHEDEGAFFLELAGTDKKPFVFTFDGLDGEAMEGRLECHGAWFFTDEAGVVTGAERYGAGNYADPILELLPVEFLSEHDEGFEELAGVPEDDGSFELLERPGFEFHKAWQEEAGTEDPALSVLSASFHRLLREYRAIAEKPADVREWLRERVDVRAVEAEFVRCVKANRLMAAGASEDDERGVA